MDTEELSSRIERERYVLAVFVCGTRKYYRADPTEWEVEKKNATKFLSQQDALKAIEVYGRLYHGSKSSRDWELWLITESRTNDWVVDSEQQLI